MPTNASKVRVIEAIGDSPAATRELWRYLLAIDWVDEIECAAPAARPPALPARRSVRTGSTGRSSTGSGSASSTSARRCRRGRSRATVASRSTSPPTRVLRTTSAPGRVEAGAARRSTPPRRRPPRRAGARLGLSRRLHVRRARARRPGRGGRARRHRPRRRALPRRRASPGAPRSSSAESKERERQFSRQSQTRPARRARGEERRAEVGDVLYRVARRRWAREAMVVRFVHDRLARDPLGSSPPPRQLGSDSVSPGRLAQLGEHQLDKLGVTGSSPVPPIKKGPGTGPFCLPRRRRKRAEGKLA